MGRDDEFLNMFFYRLIDLKALMQNNQSITYIIRKLLVTGIE